MENFRPSHPSKGCVNLKQGAFLYEGVFLCYITSGFWQDFTNLFKFLSLLVVLM